MAGATVDEGHGITVVFTTSGFTGELESVDWSGVTRESIPTSHMGTAAPGANQFGNETSIPSDLSNPGVLTMVVAANTGQSGATAQPPIDKVAETVTLTWPLVAGGATAATWAASGYCTSLGMPIEMKTKILWTLAWTISGNVTIVAAT